MHLSIPLYLAMLFLRPVDKPTLRLVKDFEPVELKMLRGPGQMCFTPDGNSVVVGTFVVSLADGKVVADLMSVMKAGRGADVPGGSKDPKGRTRPAQPPVWPKMYVTDGGKTLVWHGDAGATLWDLTTIKKSGDSIRCLSAASADGSVFAGVDHDAQVMRPKEDPGINFYQKGKLWWPFLTVPFEGYQKAFGYRVLALSPDGSRAVVGQIGKLELWDLKEKKKVRTLDTIPGFEKNPQTCSKVSAAEFTPDSKRLVVSGGGPRPTENEYIDFRSFKPAVWVWDLSDGTVSPATAQQDAYRTVRSVHFLDADSFIAVEEWEPMQDPHNDALYRVVHYDLKKGKLTPLTNTREVGVKGMAVSPDGKKLAVATNGGLRVYAVLLPKGGK